MTDTRVPLLAVDIETNTSDAASALLLEVGFALLSPDLDVIARASWVVPWRTLSLQAIRDRHCIPLVQDMHTTSGLWKACDAGDNGLTLLAGQDVLAGNAAMARLRWPERPDIVSWLTEHASDPRIPLFGSSVHYDRDVLRAWLPEVFQCAGEYRTYRLADVSAVRELLARWAPHIVAGAPGGRKLHRVDPDLDDTIGEARYYRDALGLSPGASRPFTDADAAWVRECIASVAHRDDDGARLIADHGADLLRHYGYLP